MRGFYQIKKEMDSQRFINENPFFLFGLSFT